MLADFHIHSTFSDGRLSIPELVDLYGSRGFGAIAITDHLCEEASIAGRAARWLGRTLTPATFPLYTEILRSERVRAWEQYGMVVIAGFELTQNFVSNRKSAHILALGVEEFLTASGDAADLARAVREKGGLSIAAHPVSTRKIEKQTLHLWDRREELRASFDAWEVASGPHLFEEVLGSGLPLLANSDLHHPRQITSWKTVFYCERKQEAIFEAIRKQDLGFRFYEEKHDVRRWFDARLLGARLHGDAGGDLGHAAKTAV